MLPKLHIQGGTWLGASVGLRISKAAISSLISALSSEFAFEPRSMPKKLSSN